MNPRLQMKATERTGSPNHWLAKWWVRLALYTVTGGLFAWLLWHIDTKQMLSLLMGIEPWTAVASAVLLMATTLIGSFNLYLFIGRDKRLSFSQFLPVYWFSWAFGLLVPGQVGDIASLSWLLRRYSLPASVSLGRAGLDKLISAIIMLTVAGVGLMLLFAGQVFRIQLLPLVFVLGIIVLILIVVAYIRRQQIAGLVGRPGYMGVLVRILREIVRTVRFSPRSMVLNVMLTLIKVFLTGFAYWLVLHGLGAPDLAVMEVAIIATAAGLIAYLPISVNGLGTVEVTGLFLFGQVGVPAETVLAAYILLRGLILLLAWAPLPVWMLFRKVSVKHAK